MAPIASSAALFILVWGLYIIYSAIWRLLAALTQWYELYYDIVRGGKYVWKIGELHDNTAFSHPHSNIRADRFSTLSPIIRINPWELHVNDPEFYDELYAGGGARRDKHVLLTGAFGNLESMIGAVSHSKHRQRRAPLNKFFWRASITRLEPLIQSAVDTLCSRLGDFQKEKKEVLISSGWSCLTNDVVSEYAFGKSYNYWKTHMTSTRVSTMPCAMIMPWAIGPMQKLPKWIMKMLDPKTLSFIDFQKDIAAHIKDIITGANDTYESVSHPTIFHEILNSNLPPKEKKLGRLWQEGQRIIGASTETTAWALSVTTFHLLSNLSIRHKLLQELKPLFNSTDGKPTFNQLEQLPYLGGVISEGLILSYGVTTHLQRVSPDTPIPFQTREIPPGTPVSMSSILLHQNPTIFPNPYTFDPSGLETLSSQFQQGQQAVSWHESGVRRVVSRSYGMQLVGV
ncbi:Cytochrome P450 monooxygenase [Lachnellula subtilissima]|uniref:Cytochrome P450 monooxygenase n=1 Tax=Lachnellula subtilissima TaxID=602034 RepID=A0A8H8UF37_9HELO|nr:Cytochrome P450 monooxygenase [Lachnellula subtilissima]